MNINPLSGRALSTFVASVVCTCASATSNLPAQLMPITVLADPLGAHADRAASPTSILVGPALLERRQNTLGNTLDGLPGVHNDTFGGGASRPVIRGQTAPRVMVLSDGSSLMDASTISPDHAITIEPLLADRIEVLRGPTVLRYGGGAIGGVVNVLDRRVPTEVPAAGIEADIELRAATGTKERAGVLGITAGTGNFAVRVEGLKRRASNYSIPGGTVVGSYNASSQGSLGMSWIGTRGYVGLAFTQIDSKYGIPGHSHQYQSCHPHGWHLHCGEHDEDEHGHEHEDDHDHPHVHGADASIPYIKLRSHRTDLRAEYRDPLPGFGKMRWRAGYTDYQHREIEGAQVATHFKNKGYDLRLELEHKPVLGWRGVVGAQMAYSDFRADGAEAFLPRSKTRNRGLFLLEEYLLQNWRFEWGARQDWQTVAPANRQRSSRLSGASLSAAIIWDFAPAYSIGLSWSHSRRLPTAQELYANGVHLATNTYEIGNAKLDAERARNLDLSLRKHAGATTFSVSIFYNQIKNYIYADTLDRFEDFRLIAYTQRNAKFVGVEGEIKHQFTSIFSGALFGDYVRGELSGAGNLPRIPAARLGARVRFDWQAWTGSVEYVHRSRQRHLAAFESRTSGYSSVDALVSYRFKAGVASYELYLQGKNLFNRIAYNHTSFLAQTVPLPGRSIWFGVRMTY